MAKVSNKRIAEIVRYVCNTIQNHREAIQASIRIGDVGGAARYTTSLAHFVREYDRELR